MFGLPPDPEVTWPYRYLVLATMPPSWVALDEPVPPTAHFVGPRPFEGLADGTDGQRQAEVAGQALAGGVGNWQCRLQIPDEQAKLDAATGARDRPPRPRHCRGPRLRSISSARRCRSLLQHVTAAVPARMRVPLCLAMRNHACGITCWVIDASIRSTSRSLNPHKGRQQVARAAQLGQRCGQRRAACHPAADRSSPRRAHCVPPAWRRPHRISLRNAPSWKPL